MDPKISAVRFFIFIRVDIFFLSGPERQINNASNPERRLSVDLKKHFPVKNPLVGLLQRV